MHIFYSPGNHDDSITLDRSESHHCINVLRCKEKDIVRVINGRGTIYTSRILSADPGQVKLEILSFDKEYEKREYYLHIALAPPKNIARFEWFIEKATEIGIDKITPIITHRSERVNIRLERLNKIILAAVKQSGKAYLPVLDKPLPFNQFIKVSEATCKYIADCKASTKEHLIYMKGNLKDTIIIIGPEGDFTSEEMNNALHYGYIPVSLGKSLLRTETAGIVAAQIIANRMLISNY